MAVPSSSNSDQKRSRKKPGGDGGCLPAATAAKRRKHTEVRVVGGRIYDPENGKTCHQCRQKTMDFVAACKNLKDKPCTFKYCHKCLFNRYGEKAEDMAVVEDWNCPKCRGICNCSFCMKKRGNQPTGILVHAARATGFSNVSELLHVNGSENVGAAKILQNIDTRPTKHNASGKDRVALSPLKHDENTQGEKKQKTKNALSKENHDGKKAKRGRSELLDNENGDVNQDDVALLMEVNARMTRSGGKLKKKQENKPTKPQIVKEDLLETPNDQEIPTKKACKKTPVRDVKREKKVGKKDSNALPSQKIECDTEKQKVISRLKKIKCETKKQKVLTHLKNLDKAMANLETSVDLEQQTEYVDFPKQQTEYAEPQKKEEIPEIELPKGSELTIVAGVELKPDDVGHALQFLEFCSAFGKALNLKKGEAEYVLRELITGGRSRRGKVSAVDQFHIQLVSLLQEEYGENSMSEDSTNGNTTWLHELKDCVTEFALEKLKLGQFGKSSDNYDNLNSSEKLVLLNLICDELLCTEKLRTWIVDQNSKYSEKMKEAKERVLTAKQKEKHFKQKMQDELVKAIISKNGAPLSISEHDTILSKIKSETALAHAELLEAKEVVPDEKQKSEAVRTQPIIYDVDGHIYWRLKGQPNEPNILLQDIGTWDEVGSGEKWFTYTVEEEKVINQHIIALRMKRLNAEITGKPSRRARKAHQIECDG